MPTPPMTSAAAGQLTWRVRKLHRRGDLTHADLALADALIWAARKPGSAVVVASYSALERLARVARSTVAAGLRRLEALDVFTRIKRRLRVVWGGGSASRQDVSAYVLRAPADRTEFDGRSVDQSLKNLPLAPASEVAAAQAALARRRAVLAGRFAEVVAG